MKIRRGDYKLFKFQRKNKKKEIITDLPNKMYFTVKENEYKEKALFQKTLENGITYTTNDNYYHIEILPEDTDNLAYGNYKYDIEIIYDSTKRKTLIVDELEITEEITHKNNEG